MVRVGVLLGTYNIEERKRRQETIESYSTAELSAEVFPAPADPYSTNLTGGLVGMIVPEFVRAAKEAEAAGVDAVVPFGTLDIGVDTARTFLSIPVVGALEAGLRIASFVGDKIGFVTYTSHASQYQMGLTRFYGLEHRVVGTRSLDISLNQIVDAQDRLRSAFVAAAKDLKRIGAQVIIPAGVTMCPVWIRADSLAAEIGVPVVECVGAPIRIAALLAESRLTVSRERYPFTDLPLRTEDDVR